MTTQTITPQSPIAEIERYLLRLACPGQGLRFPDFSRECPGDDWADCWDGKATRRELQGHQSDCAQYNMPAYPNKACDCGIWPICSTCNGLGRVAAITLEAVFGAAFTKEYTVLLWYLEDYWRDDGHWVCQFGFAKEGHGPTPLEAAKRALVAAVLVEEAGT